jgi:hypothetical protein
MIPCYIIIARPNCEHVYAEHFCDIVSKENFHQMFVDKVAQFMIDESYHYGSKFKSFDDDFCNNFHYDNGSMDMELIEIMYCENYIWKKYEFGPAYNFNVMKKYKNLWKSLSKKHRDEEKIRRNGEVKKAIETINEDSE